MAPALKALAALPSSNSPDHNAKGTQSENTPGEPKGLLLPLVSMWFQDLFHSPHWGAFHLSLTVLVHYRSHRSLSPWRVVPPASRPITRVGRYSGTPLTALGLQLRGFHPLWRAIPGDFPCRLCCRPWVLQPRAHKEHGLGFGRFRSPLLPASQLIPLPPGTEMFQFPGFALASASDWARAQPGCPIRPSKDQCVCAAPLGLSQLTTAFIASVCPGILHMLSLA